MNKEKIYSGKQCEEYYKKYNLVSAVHKIIDLEEVLDKIKEYIYKTYEEVKNEDGTLPLTLHDQNILELLEEIE